MEPALAWFPVALLSLFCLILIFLWQFFLRLGYCPGRGALMAFPSSQGLDSSGLTGPWACFARPPCGVREGLLGAPAAFYSWPASFSGQCGGLFGALLFSSQVCHLPCCLPLLSPLQTLVMCRLCVGVLCPPHLFWGSWRSCKKCSVGFWFCYLVALSLCKNWGRPVSMLSAPPLSPRIS